MTSGPVWLVASAETAERWRAAVVAAGWAAVAIPVSDVLPVGGAGAWRARLRDEAPDLVWLTSPNAAALLPAGFGAGWAAACVGTRTAELATACGFDVRHVGRGTAADLAEGVIAAERPGRVLFLRGREARREGVRRLRAAGFAVVEEVVYAARPRGDLPAAVAAAPAPGRVVVGSPLAADALDGALAATGRTALRARPAVAVGLTTAARLEALGWTAVGASEVPGLAGVLGSLRAHPSD